MHKNFFIALLSTINRFGNYTKFLKLPDRNNTRRAFKRHEVLLKAGLVSLFVILLFAVVGKVQTEKRLQGRLGTSQISDRALAYTTIGFDFKEEQRPYDAERALKLAIEIDPKNSKQAYLGLAELYRFYMPEKDNEIPELLRRGLTYDPQDIILLRALAQYYERVGDIGEARHWYGQILEYYPQDAPARQKIDSLR